MRDKKEKEIQRGTRREDHKREHRGNLRRQFRRGRGTGREELVEAAAQKEVPTGTADPNR